MTFIPFKDPAEADLIMDPLLPKLRLNGISFNFDFVQTSIFGIFQGVDTHLAKYCAIRFDSSLIAGDRFELTPVRESWQNLSLGFDLRGLRGLRWHSVGLMCA